MATLTTARTPVKELTEGQAIQQAFRVADKQVRVNRQGGKYLFLRLADRSGKIVAMMWNVDDRVADSFDKDDYVYCDGRTQVHNGALQIIVTKLEQMDPAEVDESEFDQFDAEKSEGLLTRLGEILGSLRNAHLRDLGQLYLSDRALVAKLKTAPAAVVHHHAYPGGLLQHTVDLMELTQSVASHYPRLDGELLTFGAFLHDLGKMEEMSGEGEASYTDRGQMVGHIVIGIQMLGDKILQLENQKGPFPAELRLHLEHMIVSHHGELEFGSPRLPATLEAVALHHLDNLDAKLSSYASVIDQDVATDGNWTNYNPTIGRKLWKPS